MQAAQVVMFPGLGASYAQMVGKFVAAHPGAEEALREWSWLVDAELGAPVTEDAADGREAARRAQLEIHALNLLWWRQRRAEARAAGAAVCGHSLGYYAALVAAGVLDEASSFKLVDTAFGMGWQAFGHGDDEVFVLTATDALDFDAALQGLPVELLSDNSPMQRVLCGPPGSVEKVRARLGKRLLAVSTMPTHVPFHSARLQAVCARFAERIVQMGIVAQPMQMPVWSHIGARPVADAQAALALVPAQLCRPVRWGRLIDALVQSGRYEFIEVGPNRVLSQVVRWISPQLEVSFVDRFRRQGAQA
jgi:[acyl-carrier-protein] S-malonyltransferase